MFQTSEMAAARKKIFDERGEHIRNVCESLDWKKYSEPSMTLMDKNLRWSSKYHLLWCPIFKVSIF